MFGRKACALAMTIGTDNAGDLSSDVADSADTKAVSLGGMVRSRGSGYSHRAVMTAGTIEPLDTDPNMTGDTFTHLIGHCHMVLINDRSLIVFGVTGGAIKLGQIDGSMAGGAGHPVTFGRRMVALVDRRGSHATMTIGTFDQSRIGAGMAIDAIAGGCGRSCMMHLRVTIQVQAVMTTGTGQIRGINGRMACATVIAIVFSIGLGRMVHGRPAVLALAGMTAGTVQASRGDASMTFIAFQAITGCRSMVTRGEHRYLTPADMTPGTVNTGEGDSGMTVVAILVGKIRTQMVHSRGTVTIFALMTSSAIQSTGDVVNPLMTGITFVAGGGIGFVMHIRGAVFHCLSRMTALTGAVGNRSLSTGMALGTVVAVVFFIGRRGVVHAGRAVQYRLIVVASSTIKRNRPFMTEDAVIIGICVIGVVHSRRAIVVPPGMAGGAVETFLRDPRMAGHTKVIDRRLGVMMHGRRTIFDRLRGMTAFASPGYSRI